MPIITLPDGSQRSFDRPVTVAEVAADIGKGLARAALAGEVDGKLVDTAHRRRPRREASHHHGEGPRRARDPAPFDRAPARAGRAVDLSRRRRSRSARSSRTASSTTSPSSGPSRPRTSRSSRQKMRELVKADQPVRRARAAARCGGRALQVDWRALQGGDHRGDSGGRGDLALRPGRMGRPVPRPARAVDRQAGRVQADEGRRRLLARRFAQRDAPAHLRHGLARREAAQGLPARASRRPRSATTAASAASSTSSISRKRRRAPFSGIRTAGPSSSS